MNERNNQWQRLPWLCLAWTSLALGAAGAVLPLVPTTPFILLAAWSAHKGSPRLERWLHGHKHFGPLLHAWHKEGAVPASAKVTALILLIVSWVILWRLQSAPWVLGLTGLLFSLVSVFLLTRSSPSARGHARND